MRATAPGSRLALQGRSRGLFMLGWMVAMVLVVSVVKVHVLQLDASHHWYSRFEYTIGGMMFVTLKVRRDRGDAAWCAPAAATARRRVASTGA